MPTPQRYRKKAVEIEAMRFEEDSSWVVVHWVNQNGGNAHLTSDGIMITTLEGDMRGGFGDYVIRGVQGEFYPCKPDIFAKTYDAA